MLIKNIESKIRLATILSLGSLVTVVIVVIVMAAYSFKTSMNERKKIYVLNGSTPIEVVQTDAIECFEIEARAQINDFHTLFFTLPADDQYIQRTVEKAMYLIDESGLRQYNTLRERGFYSSILSSSANVTITTDSIVMDMENQSFFYYGTQRIERPTSILRRQLITSGKFKQCQRTQNNAHGILLYDWRTELNKDIDYKSKRSI